MVSVEGKSYISPKVKLLALEVLNMSLSYASACQRFINYKIADPSISSDGSNYEFFKKELTTVETSTKESKKEKRSRSRKKSSRKK